MTAVLSLPSLSAFAFAPVPKESAVALKVTRGKPFSSGAVFVNGKFIEPPYVVERWGTGIRINGKQVTGQVVDWGDFIRTQKDVKTVRKESSAATSGASQTVPAATADVDAGSLDDLFDDDPKPKAKAVARKQPAAARPSVSYELAGDFAPNEATKALLARINAFRTEIDRTLRSGGFICFGDSYAQVTGDSRTLMNLLEKLPACQRDARDLPDFCDKVRASSLVYLHESLRRDLYRNRIDYRKLQDLRTKLKRDTDVQRMLDSASRSLF